MTLADGEPEADKVSEDPFRTHDAEEEPTTVSSFEPGLVVGNGGREGEVAVDVCAAAGTAKDTGTNTAPTNATAATTPVASNDDRETPRTERPTRASEITHHSPHW